MVAIKLKITWNLLWTVLFTFFLQRLSVGSGENYEKFKQ